ncbi:MAG: fumarate hydratase [Candidatus Margulisbacteria bacterium]|jgi:fumarate hydratase subunit alpha|nr:fumarate hydratase [Candidatus Margulisiibacteriota bacterium]
MREISAELIAKKIAATTVDLNLHLPPDVERALREAEQNETSPQGRTVLQKLWQNAQAARADGLPLCQDTGTCVVFLEIGQEAHIAGNLNEAIQSGVARGYQSLRKSIVRDPLDRVNTQDNTPAVIHTEIVTGDTFKINLLAKGGGAENKSALYMLRPTTDKNEIIAKIVETVRKADSAPCPPLILGIGLGGTFDTAPILAKKALLREIGSAHPDQNYAALEKEILQAVNKLNIGPAGYGGITTALAAFILTAPCHIASLPLAVNIQCHAARHCEIML